MQIFRGDAGKRKDDEPADPTVIHVYSKVHVYPDEHWAEGTLEKAGNWLKYGKHEYSGISAGDIHFQGRGGARGVMAGMGGGVAGMIANSAMSGSTVGKTTGGQAAQPKEILANTFELTTNEVRAKLDRSVVVNGIYNAPYLIEKIKGAGKINSGLLREAIPQPNTKSGFYNQAAMERIKNIEKEIPKGVWTLGIVVGGSAKEGGTFRDNEFTYHIARINNHVTINREAVKVEKKESPGKAFLHAKDLGGEYSFDPSKIFNNKLEDDVKVTEYRVTIGDKDDKKHNVNIFEGMSNFISEKQQMIKDITDYAFLRTERKDTFKLSENFLRDFNS